MPRTVTYDGVKLIQLHVFPDVNGLTRVQMEYGVMRGGVIDHTKQMDMTTTLDQVRMAQVTALFEQLQQDLAAIELA